MKEFQTKVCRLELTRSTRRTLSYFFFQIPVSKKKVKTHEYDGQYEYEYVGGIEKQNNFFQMYLENVADCLNKKQKEKKFINLFLTFTIFFLSVLKKNIYNFVLLGKCSQDFHLFLGFSKLKNF